MHQSPTGISDYTKTSVKTSVNISTVHAHIDHAAHTHHSIAAVRVLDLREMGNQNTVFFQASIYISFFLFNTEQ